MIAGSQNIRLLFLSLSMHRNRSGVRGDCRESIALHFSGDCSRLVQGYSVWLSLAAWLCLTLPLLPLLPLPPPPQPLAQSPLLKGDQRTKPPVLGLRRPPTGSDDDCRCFHRAKFWSNRVNIESEISQEIINGLCLWEKIICSRFCV